MLSVYLQNKYTHYFNRTENEMKNFQSFELRNYYYPNCLAYGNYIDSKEPL